MSLRVKTACRIVFLKKFITNCKGVARVISTNSSKKEISWGRKPVGDFKSTREQFPSTKKRLSKKKKQPDEGVCGFRVAAFSTAEEYNLESLKHGLESTAFKPTPFSSECGNTADFIHAVDTSQSEVETKDLFFFREGSVVMWNITDSESQKLLKFLKSYEDSSFTENIVQDESEIMSYNYSPDVNKTRIIKDQLVFSHDADMRLEKYTISDAMGLSVLLGTYEANLEHYIETMEPVTEDLKTGGEIKMSRGEVLRKMGQLFAMRHNIILSSNLLDTPDFYWDRGDLENLYQAMSSYFCISKRTRVMNERINHCIELVQLLSTHLNDNHHIRLEWMIIILIMVEVGFEILHFLDRFLESDIQTASVPTSPNVQ